MRTLEKLLLFGGTSDAHALLEAFLPHPIHITLCVTSGYARQLLPEESGRIRILIGRMDALAMLLEMRRERYFCVLDATHPYAVEASRNIKSAAEQSGLPYIRLVREKSGFYGGTSVRSAVEAAQTLNGRTGPALIATGTKELAPFTSVPNYQERLYVRTLPTVEAIEACLSLGFSNSRIIAMQGPFTTDFNLALLTQYRIRTLITKDGGVAGGFYEKCAAARRSGVELIVIKRPQEQGETLTGAIQRVLRLLEEHV